MQVLHTRDVNATMHLYRDLTTFLVAQYSNLTAVPGGGTLPSMHEFDETTKDGNLNKNRSVADIWQSMLSTVKGACR